MRVESPVGKTITNAILPSTCWSMDPTNVGDVWDRSQERFTLNHTAFGLGKVVEKVKNYDPNNPKVKEKYVACNLRLRR